MSRQLIAGILGFTFLAALGYRIIGLEAQLEELSRQIDDSVVGVQHDATTTPASQASTPPSELNHHQRLVALERQLGALRAGLFRIHVSMQPNSGDPDPQTVEDILNVVEGEHSRVLHTHFEKERPRWLETRKAQLTSFAHTHHLSHDQVRELESGLAREVDAMIEVLQRPDLYEDPERTARDWKQLLAETDRIAGRTLSQEQLATWNQARLFERKLLWPWLPDEG